MYSGGVCITVHILSSSLSYIQRTRTAGGDRAERHRDHLRAGLQCIGVEKQRNVFLHLFLDIFRHNKISTVRYPHRHHVLAHQNAETGFGTSQYA